MLGNYINSSVGNFLYNIIVHFFLGSKSKRLIILIISASHYSIRMDEIKKKTFSIIYVYSHCEIHSTQCMIFPFDFKCRKMIHSLSRQVYTNEHYFEYSSQQEKISLVFDSILNHLYVSTPYAMPKLIRVTQNRLKYYILWYFITFQVLNHFLCFSILVFEMWHIRNIC